MIDDLSISETLKTIMFVNPTIENGFIAYREMDSLGMLAMDTENASQVEIIQIHGEEGTLVVKDGLTSVIWKESEKMFLIQITAEPSEAIKIAEGVKLIK